jgi:hypothetical protein
MSVDHTSRTRRLGAPSDAGMLQPNPESGGWHLPSYRWQTGGCVGPCYSAPGWLSILSSPSSLPAAARLCYSPRPRNTLQRGVYAQPSFGDGLDFPACEVAACGVASRVVEVSGGTPSGTKASVAPEGCKPCRALLGRDGCREPHCKGC